MQMNFNRNRCGPPQGRWVLGGDVDLNDINPVQKILAEPAGANHVLEIEVGGGDQPDVGLPGRRVADGFVLAVLIESQDFRLKIERKVSDLVEKQRAAFTKGDATCDPLSPFEMDAAETIFGNRRNRAMALTDRAIKQVEDGLRAAEK